MSFKAQFKVSGKVVNVLNCNYALKQETDATGRPSSITRGGKINMTVESTGDTTFFEWMTNNFERKDGTITFIKRDSDATMKELNFKEGYLVDYKENFDASGDNPVTESFTISAKEISVGSGKHTNEWVKM
jgi:type VI secretion system TssD-like protein